MKTIYTLVVTAMLLATMTPLVSAQLLDTTRIVMTEFDGEKEVSSDDAEQINDEIDKLFDDDLDMGWEGDEFNIVTVGLRFTDIQVPHGAQIDSAFIEIFAHEDEGDPANITIWGEANDNPITFNDVDLITDRPQTDAQTRWEITEEWTIWTKYRTPDITSIVQELVDRPGWLPGNSMVFVFEGEDQGASNEDNARDFESFENEEDPDDGGDGLNHPERIPKLYVYYSTTSSADNIATGETFKLEGNLISNNQVFISYSGLQSKPVSLDVYATNGAHVQNLTQNLPVGQRQMFYLNNLDAGLYILRASSSEFSKSYKIFVH